MLHPERDERSRLAIRIGLIVEFSAIGAFIFGA
jgi:hypothetical protein